MCLCLSGVTVPGFSAVAEGNVCSRQVNVVGPALFARWRDRQPADPWTAGVLPLAQLTSQ